MKAVLDFLKTYEAVIYILLGVVGFFYLVKLVTAWREWRNSFFGLERESAQRRLSSALAVVIILGLLAFVEFVLVSFVIPVYPQLVVLRTPTLNLLATSTSTVEAGQSTQTIQTEPVTTLSVIITQGCIPGKVEWTSPKNSDEISGTVELTGSVDVSDLGFYKFEYSQPGSNEWTIIAGDNKPKKDQPLGGIWNTAVLVPGEYFLRLVVFDSKNQPLATCQISVRVLAPK